MTLLGAMTPYGFDFSILGFDEKKALPEFMYNPHYGNGALPLFTFYLWTILRGKHCLHPNPVMGVAYAFEPGRISLNILKILLNQRTVIHQRKSFEPQVCSNLFSMGAQGLLRITLNGPLIGKITIMLKIKKFSKPFT